MAYDSGFLDARIEVHNRATATSNDFAMKVGGAFSLATTIWANVQFSKGMKALHEGAIDAYEILMVRCRPNTLLDRDSRLKIDGKMYVIQSYNEDRKENQVQITCIELQ